MKIELKRRRVVQVQEQLSHKDLCRSTLVQAASTDTSWTGKHIHCTLHIVTIIPSRINHQSAPGWEIELWNSMMQLNPLSIYNVYWYTFMLQLAMRIVQYVSSSVNHSLDISTDFTGVSLVSEDSNQRLIKCLVIKVVELKSCFVSRQIYWHFVQTFYSGTNYIKESKDVKIVKEVIWSNRRRRKYWTIRTFTWLWCQK